MPCTVGVLAYSPTVSQLASLLTHLGQEDGAQADVCCCGGRDPAVVDSENVAAGQLRDLRSQNYKDLRLILALTENGMD